MSKTDQLITRVDPDTRAWTRLASTLCKQSESAFVRDAIAEKLERLFVQPPVPNEPPPPCQDPEVTLRTSTDRPRVRKASRLSEAATRADVRQLRPVAASPEAVLNSAAAAVGQE